MLGERNEPYPTSLSLWVPLIRLIEALCAFSFLPTLFAVIEYLQTGALVEDNFDPLRSSRDSRVMSDSRLLIG